MDRMIPRTKKVAFITGITGQDGSIMADLLLEKGYEVHGLLRRSATFNTKNIDHIFGKLQLHHGDITDAMSLFTIINKIKPDEIYNFCGMSHVKVSASIETYTMQTNTLGVLNLLQSVRQSGLTNTCRIYQANTSETYGNKTDGTTLLTEETARTPVSIYGISKNCANDICDMYRKAYGMFIVSSTLFNHESIRRGHTFITQKVAQYVGRKKFDKPLELGNINSMRDWSAAEDFMEAVWLMIQQKTPNDFVLASGECRSVRELVEIAFKEIDIDIEWIGSGIDEVGIDKDTKKVLVKVNPKYYRDLELHALIGDASKAKRMLNWEPKTSFSEMISKMVKAAGNEN